MGADSAESLSEQTLESFEELARHPLRINFADRASLAASGLFSMYQLASLEDYRTSHGDVLSWMELSGVDGFDEEYARAVSPFVSFSSAGPAAAQDVGQVDGIVSFRSASKTGGFGWKGKCALNIGPSLSSFAAVKEDSYSFSLSSVGQRSLKKVMAGDFNARFGQGLTLWSGFSLSGMSAPSSLYRRSTGLKPSSSYSDTGLRGAAAEFVFGSLAFSSFLAMPTLRGYMEGKTAWKPALMPGANVEWFFRNGQLSMTFICREGDGDRFMRAGVDGRFCIRGADVFAELSTDPVKGMTAAVGGLVFPFAGHCSAGLLGRFYPENFPRELAGAVRAGSSVRDEAGGTVSFQRKNLVFSADYSRKKSVSRNQLKLCLKDDVGLCAWMNVRPRMSARFRNTGERMRVDLRNDFVMKSGGKVLTCRLNWLKCRSDAFLAYAEPGYVGDCFSVYARGVVFVADSWADRIYAYERDAPGNFSVPAYYGRGYGISLLASCRVSIGRSLRLKFYCRGHVLSYPWLSPGQERKKPGKSGLSFQFSADF